MQEICVSKEAQNQSLYKFICKILPFAPDSFLQKLFRKKEIRVNGKKEEKDFILKANDIVRIYIKDEAFFEFSSKEVLKKSHLNIPIIYENDDIIFLNKPRGVLTQASEKKEECVNDFLYDYLGVKEGFKPSTCNRLDKNTSGIVCAGKTVKGLQELSLALREKRVKKFYKTIVCNNLEREIHDVAYMKRSNKKSYLDSNGYKMDTRVIPIRYIGNYTLCDVEILTGKTHQIRLHLSSLGYPIIGDVKYGGDSSFIKYQLLHCSDMIFDSDIGCNISNKHIHIDVGDEFKSLIRRLEDGNLVN